MSNGPMPPAFLARFGTLFRKAEPSPSFASTALAFGRALLVSAPFALLLACTPAIGDRCALSSECSIQGNRTCDLSQPNGYCTILGCSANSCPDNAACVVFGASVQGCPYNDYSAPSRTGRAMCLKTCSGDSDCRQSEGYVCVQLPQPPWQGGPPWTVILDTNTSRRVCVLAASSNNATVQDANVTIQDAAVCSANRPVTTLLDAMVTLEDAPLDVGDVGPDAPPEGADVIVDGAPEAMTEGGDVSVLEAAPTGDAGSDVQVDAMQDAAIDAGVVDAPDGG